MKIKFEIVIDENDTAGYFRASTDSGKVLSHFESAYYLSKVMSSLVRNGLETSGHRLVMPTPINALPNIR